MEVPSLTGQWWHYRRLPNLMAKEFKYNMKNKHWGRTVILIRNYLSQIIQSQTGFNYTYDEWDSDPESKKEYFWDI